MFKPKIKINMEKRIVQPLAVNTTRLVKSEDLNHHGTLFAGRTAEWFVESGFIAAASLLNPQGIVCLKIHGLYFTKPVRPGQILKFVSKVVYTGKSSLVSYIHVTNDGSTEPYVSGFITFIYVDEKTKAAPHNIEIAPHTDEDKELYERAKALKKK
jgi:acyl-CoA hydrolase